MTREQKIKKFAEDYCTGCCYKDNCYNISDCLMKGHFVFYGVDKNAMEVLGLKVSGVGNNKFFMKAEEIYGKLL